MNAHRWRSVHAFLEMLVPRADALGPGRSIVVRPHPSESHEAWLAAAGGRANVHVLHEGTIIPWLLAAEAGAERLPDGGRGLPAGQAGDHLSAVRARDVRTG